MLRRIWRVWWEKEKKSSDADLFPVLLSKYHQGFSKRADVTRAFLSVQM